MSFLFPHSCSFEVSFCRVSTSSSLWILFMALCQQCTPKVPHRGCHKCLICVSGKELVQAQCTLLWGIPDLSKNFKDFWSSTKTSLVLPFRNCWILFPNFTLMRIRLVCVAAAHGHPCQMLWQNLRRLHQYSSLLQCLQYLVKMEDQLAESWPAGPLHSALHPSSHST